jgi:hypothetical protein
MDTTGLSMWLVLCERDDRDALWAHGGLVARGLTPVEFVTANDLVAARRWEHTLGADGMSIGVELGDGRVIEGDAVRGALNRLVGIPPEPLERAARADREYATQEIYAFFLSWLAVLPGRVLNTPSPQGLSGRWLEHSEWLTLAHRAGLRTPRFRRSNTGGGVLRDSRRTLGRTRQLVIVVGDRALGPPAPDHVAAGCARLSQLTGAAILGVEFTVGDGQWIFYRATTLPALRRGGERLLDLLADALLGPSNSP